MSIFDPGPVADVPTWRCPHCRTLQPEASRCRACQRPAVSCATCRRYRRSLLQDLGSCADDPARTPLRGDTQRACWTTDEAAVLPPGGMFERLAPTPGPDKPATPDGIDLGSPSAHADASPTLLAAQPAALAGRLLDAPPVAPTGNLELRPMKDAKQEGRRAT
jgi:hypothetical protein